MTVLFSTSPLFTRSARRRRRRVKRWRSLPSYFSLAFMLPITLRSFPGSPLRTTSAFLGLGGFTLTPSHTVTLAFFLLWSMSMGPWRE